MGLVDGLRRQMRSVIEWENPQPDELFHHWSANGDEIKNASKLIVGPGQGCIFVYEGVPKSMIVKNGMVDLRTDNIPFWTTITKFMQLFESEHKMGIYYFRTTKVLDQKWGTNSPIKYEDSKYNFPVSLKAFGNYSFRIQRPADFFINIVGDHNDFSISQFREMMNSRIVQPLTDHLAESKYTYVDIDSKREELSQELAVKLQKDFIKLGFKLTDMRIEGTNFDEDTLERINRIADITAEVHAATAAGLDYASLQKLEAMREAARNEGGGAGVGMGIGAGMGFGQMMASSMGDGLTPKTEVDDPVAKLKQLKKMFEAELISQQEYDDKKSELLSRF